MGICSVQPVQECSYCVVMLQKLKIWFPVCPVCYKGGNQQNYLRKHTNNKDPAVADNIEYIFLGENKA